MSIKIQVDFYVSPAPKTIEDQREMEDKIKKAIANNVPLYLSSLVDCDDGVRRELSCPVTSVVVRSYFPNGRDKI